MSRLGSAVLLLLGLAACDSTGPGSDRPTYFRATLDGLAWEADTSLGLAFGAATDTSITLTALRRVSPSKYDQITVLLKHWGSSIAPIGDTAAPAIGAYSITQVAGDSVVGFLPFLSTAEEPGQLAITTLARRDSLITGTGHFEAATTPDTMPHHRITVEFRLRYSLQPVFVPE